MSVFSQTYENVENAVATISQATTTKELVSLYLNNQRIFDTFPEARKSLMSAMAQMEKKEGGPQFAKAI